MSKRLQTGGSQGEPVRAGMIPFFFPEVKAVELITKNIYGIRLLPAFQRDDANLATSPTSIRPYRDAANVDSSNAKAVFTDWYYSLKGYKFLGNDGRAFLSPLIMEKTDHRGIDPLFDCYHLARNSKDSHPDWYDLTEKDEGEKNAILEKYRVFCCMNALLQVDNSPVNRLVMVTKASLDHLKEQLDVLCSRSDTPNDPDWQDFMLGDVTSPLHGLWGTVQKGVFNKAGMEASLFSFSRSKDRLVNVVKYPVDPNTPWGQEVLAARYDIGDLEKVTRVATAAEILDYIINDGFLPMELIREACSPFWDVPEGRIRRTAAPRAYDESADTRGGGNFAPRPPAGAPPIPAMSNRRFWIVMPGSGQISPQPMPESVVRSMVNQQQHDLTIMLEGEQVWKTSADFGIFPVAAPKPVHAAPSAPPASSAPPPPPHAAHAAPPPPPAAPKPPTPPARVVAPGAPPPPARPAPVQPAATARSAPPPPPPSASVAPMAPPNPPPAPTANSSVFPLTDAERAEWTDLEKEWLEAIPKGIQMASDRVARYCELSDRASAVTAG